MPVWFRQTDVENPECINTWLKEIKACCFHMTLVNNIFVFTYDLFRSLSPSHSNCRFEIVASARRRLAGHFFLGNFIKQLCFYLKETLLIFIDFLQCADSSFTKDVMNS